MSAPRRRVLRPVPAVPIADARRLATLNRKRSQLEKEREALARWMSKLKRAFRAIERIQARTSRVERQIATLEQA